LPDIEIDMAGISVMLAMPTHRDLSPSVVKSIILTTCELKDRNIPFCVQMEAGSSIVHHVRSMIAHDFLKSDYSRLFWVDSDITWEPDDFLRFLAMSTRMDVVCGAYPAKQDPPLFLLGIENRTVESNEFGCVPLGGVGLGFSCIQRHVIEELAANAPKLKFHNRKEPIPGIFRFDTFTEKMTAEDFALGYEAEARGEDMAFFTDIRALGYTVWVDPSITLGHIGPKTYTGSLGKFVVKDEQAEAA
jgi:hypothetical protein